MKIKFTIALVAVMALLVGCNEPTTPNPPTADQIIEVNGLKWTTGNLVAVAGKTDQCKVGAPGDAGLYFQFGSLIGWSGGVLGDGVGVGEPALAINVKPSAYTGSTEWTTYIYYSEGTSDVAATGVGDPCRFYLGGEWRTPTVAEFTSLCNGYAKGSDLSAANAAWVDSLVAGMSFNDSVTKLFVPASGLRHNSDGSFNDVGTNGYYWSASVSNASSGYYLNFNSDNVYSQNYHNRRLGFPVRCVAGEVIVEPTKPNPPTADQIIEINGVKWATGNLVAVAGKADQCKVGAPRDAGLYFQFGSLIGWSGGRNGDGRGMGEPALAINVKPFAYAGWAEWATYGYYSEVDDAITGVGDPCRFYLGGEWRLPTAAEFISLGNGYAKGSNLVSANAAWVDSPVAGVNFNNNGTKLFIPASGYRNSGDGSFYYVGAYGTCWSASVGDESDGYYLGFNSSHVTPQSNHIYRHGLPVRCVAGAPTVSTVPTVPTAPTVPNPPTADQVIEIGGLKWTTGNLVATNATNAKVGAPGDCGLYFKFGSLIGWSGGKNGDGVGIGFPALTINAKPSAYIGSIDYDTCGYYSRGALDEPLAADDTINGVGDPCRYYLGGAWRLPTAREFSSMCNDPEYGDASLAHANAAWVDSPVAGVNFNNDGAKLFIPASGYRDNSDGAIYNVGEYGYGRSESDDSEVNVHYLLFGSSSISVYFQDYGNRRNGFPVRCVVGEVLIGPTNSKSPTADQIIEIKGVKWAKGNLVAVAGKTDQCKIGAPTDGGLYFQFGSLIGWSGGKNGDGRGMGEPALAINVKPSAYTGPTDYTSCGYSSVGASGILISTDDAATGIGDPCRFYLGGAWRTPTAGEFFLLCNSSTKDTGLASANAAWVDSPVAGVNFNNDGTKLFILASGYRNSNDGSFYGVGTNGHYWSASVGYTSDADESFGDAVVDDDTSDGCALGFGSDNVYPQDYRNRRNGFPVRCVQ